METHKSAYITQATLTFIFKRLLFFLDLQKNEKNFDFINTYVFVYWDQC